MSTWPAYLSLYASGELAARAEQAVAALARCRVCPRNCDIDRLKDETKVCSTGRYARVSSYFPHFGEEDCLRGAYGSGTIFFSFCNLKCVFCQNHDASQAGHGDEVTPGTLAAMMLELQRAGCHNINLVTPEHVVPQILEALPIAIRGGCACRSSITRAAMTPWKAWRGWMALSRSTGGRRRRKWSKRGGSSLNPA